MKVVCRKTKALTEFIEAVRLRTDVFVREQGFKPGWEPDEYDASATQFVAVLKNKVIATARFRETAPRVFKIERMAVARKFRRKGVGARLCAAMLNEINCRKPRKVWLRSQLACASFYEKLGFHKTSKPKKIYGVTHVEMSLTKRAA